MTIHPDVKEVLLTAERIQARVQEMAVQIAADYRQREPVLVSVLDGAVVFLADLMRALPIPLRIDLSSGRATATRPCPPGWCSC